MAKAIVGRRGRRGAQFKTLGKTLINEQGKLNKANYNELRNLIKRDTEMSAEEKITTLNFLEAFIQDREAKKQATNTNSFWGWMAETDLDKLFANAGINAELAAAEIGEDIDYFRDEEHWVNNKYYGQTGIYEIQFNYSGSILKWVG